MARALITIKSKVPQNWLTRRVKPAALKAAKQALPAIRQLVADYMVKESSRQLTATAAAYQRGISAQDMVTLDKAGVTIRIIDPVAKALELGYNAYDIKAVMLAKATKQTKKGEPYIDVPMEHAASSLPKSVRQAMRKTTRLRQHTAGRVFTRELRYGKKRIMTTVEHKRGLYDDLIKQPVSVVGTNRFLTIRRISAKSAATSWMHPGFAGVHILAKLKPALQPQIRKLVVDQLRGAGFKVKA
jgi:hypothetical protein